MTDARTDIHLPHAPALAPGPWLHDVLMPWWRDHIVDPHGGFFEALRRPS